MSEEASEREQPVVLAADDDEDILELVAFRLERSGYTVLRARDGQEALDLALEARPDLAVLDVMMPKLDGFELTRRLRAEEATRRMPIILLRPARRTPTWTRASTQVRTTTSASRSARRSCAPACRRSSDGPDP
jgi:CheY-like chemotaxis protein